MNFNEAIKAHSDWKMKLSAYLDKPDGSIKPEVVQLDNKCALGQWIYGEGASHQALPEYATLKTEHAKFHKAAAEVVRKADSGQNVTQEIALGKQSEFGLCSHNVVAAIMAIKRKVQS